MNLDLLKNIDDSVDPENGEEKEEKKESKPGDHVKSSGDLIEVRKVGKDNEDIVVEWVVDNIPKRTIISYDRIQSKDGKFFVDAAALNAGREYGIPWSQFIEISPVTEQDFEDRLHQRGIWTLEDLRSGRGGVGSIFSAIHAGDIAAFMSKVKESDYA